MAGAYQPNLPWRLADVPRRDGRGSRRRDRPGPEQAGEKIDQAIHQHRELDRDQQAAEAGMQLAQDLDRKSTRRRSTRATMPRLAPPATPIRSRKADRRANGRGARQHQGSADPRAIRRELRAAQRQDRYPRIWLGNRDPRQLHGAKRRRHRNDPRQRPGDQPDPVGFETSLNTVHTSIGAMEGLPVDVKAKLIKEQERKIAVAWGNGNGRQGSGPCSHALDKGVLSPYLEPEDIKTLRNGGQIEIRRQAAEQRASSIAPRAKSFRSKISGRATASVTELNDEW
jgi:hypothetical protein